MVQYLPVDDDFAAGSPAFGSLVCMYLGCRMSVTAISGIWNPNGAAFAARPLHGGYSAVDLGTGFADYNGAFYNNGTTNRVVSGMLFRKPFGADITVTGVFEMRALLGTPGIGDFSPRGVFARVQGGSLGGSGTSEVEITAASCYAAGIYQATDSTLRFGILRWNSGSVVLLTQTASIPTGALNLTKTATVSLTCTTNGGGNVDLVATIQGLGTALTLTLNHTDSTGSKLTAAGRVGFFMGSDKELVAGRRVVDLVHLLKVDDVLQDEFQRLALGSCKQTPADLHSVTGGYLNSGWYWDAGTYDGSFVSGGRTHTGARKLGHSSSTAVMDHADTDDDVNAGRLMLSQRLADSPVSQHRTITITVPTAPTAATGEVWAGVVLRAQQSFPVDQSLPVTPKTGAGPNFPLGNGYMLVCRAKTSTTVIWQLHRIRNGAHFPIARLQDDSPFTLFPGYGSSFDLELDVFPRNEGDEFGPVQLECRLDGALLDLAIISTASAVGVYSPSTGVFVDPTSTRIVGNYGEGLVTANGFLGTGATSSTIDPIFDDWTQGALTNAGLFDADEASVTIAPEATATGSSLDSIIGEPDDDMEVERMTFAFSNPFESGHRQTMPRHVRTADDKMHVRLRYKVRKTLREDVLTALLDHNDSHLGGQLGFNFTLPGEGSPKVFHYLSPVRYTLTHAGVWTTDFDIEQLSI